MLKDKKLSKFLLVILFLGIIFFFQSCLKDDVTNSIIPALSDNAMLLSYFENNGNYINSSDMPSIAEVDEVYNNLNKYLIIDVRTMGEYSIGHIPGAVNVQKIH